MNSPELNSEGTKQRTKQKKMVDTPQPVKPVQQPVQQQQQYAQASNLSYFTNVAIWYESKHTIIVLCNEQRNVECNGLFQSTTIHAKCAKPTVT